MDTQSASLAEHVDEQVNNTVHNLDEQKYIPIPPLNTDALALSAAVFSHSGTFVKTQAQHPICE